MVVFRTATQADLGAVCDLWRAAGLGHGRDVDEAEANERFKNADGFFVIGEDENLAGLAAVAMGCYDDHRGWMKRVAINPVLQGTGVGRQLVAEVENRFRAAGITKLRLSVFDDNEVALAFWQHLDYVELPNIRYFIKDLSVKDH